MSESETSTLVSSLTVRMYWLTINSQESTASEAELWQISTYFGILAQAGSFTSILIANINYHIAHLIINRCLWICLVYIIVQAKEAVAGLRRSWKWAESLHWYWVRPLLRGTTGGRFREKIPDARWEASNQDLRAGNGQPGQDGWTGGRMDR